MVLKHQRERVYFGLLSQRNRIHNGRTCIAPSSSHDGRNGKFRAHIFKGKNKEERANERQYTVFTFKSTPRAAHLLASLHHLIPSNNASNRGPNVQMLGNMETFLIKQWALSNFF